MTDYERFGDYQASMEEGGNWRTAVTFLLIGIGIGSVVALMLAPQSGKKMRRNLRRRYENAIDRVDDMRDQANEAWERGSGWASMAARKGSGWASVAAKRVAPIARAARREID